MKDEAALELAKRELARRRLKYFIPYVMPTYQIRPHNQLIADAVDLVLSRKITRLMVFMPPQYGKSEIVSRKAPAFSLGKFPDRKVILCSYAARLANDLSRNCRDLINAQLYQNVFGESSSSAEFVTLDDDNKSVASWSITNHRGGTVSAGIGGGITGHSMDLGIIDDPVKDESENGEVYRNRAYDWYWGSFFTRLSPGSGIILCMTRWHEDDLAGRLLRGQSEFKEKWDVLRLPVMAESYDQYQRWCEENYVTDDQMITQESIKKYYDEP